MQILAIHHMEFVLYIFERGIPFCIGRLVLRCLRAVDTCTHPKHFVPGTDTIGLDVLLAQMDPVGSLTGHK